MSDPIDEAIHQAATGYAYRDGWNAAVEACARVAESHGERRPKARQLGICDAIAAAIRALKDKP